MRQGAHVAANVAASLSRDERRPFRFRTIGLVVDLGRRQAVARILGFRLRGRLAWFCARSYHLMAIPGLARRLRLAIDWTVDLFFRRDTAEWIPPKLPRLSLATMREPDAIEISIRSTPARAGDSGPDPEAPSANASKYSAQSVSGNE